MYAKPKTANSALNKERKMQQTLNEHTNLNEKTTDKTLVFDYPTRIFHWLFAFGFVGAFSIGKFVDDESALYPLHMLFGSMMAFSVFLRIIWGIFGTFYARFSSFKLNPLELVEYIKSIGTQNKARSIGRNPASSFAAIAMMAVAIIIPITGFLMLKAQNRNEFHNLKEIHEILATIFALIALLHIGGIIIHTIVHKDPIGIAMINGTKKSTGEYGITNAKPIIGALFIALIGTAAFALNAKYDGKNKTLQLGQNTLILGENEDQEHQEDNEGQRNDENEEGSEHKSNMKNHEKAESEYIQNKQENMLVPNSSNQNNMDLQKYENYERKEHNDNNMRNEDEHERKEHERNEHEKRN
jgi:cytochrome b